jgi:hypothetical protein
MIPANYNISFVISVLLLIIGFPPFIFEAHAQCDNEKAFEEFPWDFNEEENTELSFGVILSDALTPQMIIDVKQIRRYILDERFQDLRNRYGDMYAVDAIYLKSLRIANYNITRALFLSLMAVLEHKYVHIKLPLVNPVCMPLTFEKDSIFDVRVQHLPCRIYSDTLWSTEKDRDKLQHFFGSAYLAHSSEAPELTRVVGNIIEWIEAEFVVGGSDDPRDKRANRQGESFGRDLLVVNTLLPSDYLTFSSEGGK